MMDIAVRRRAGLLRSGAVLARSRACGEAMPGRRLIRPLRVDRRPSMVLGHLGARMPISFRIALKAVRRKALPGRLLVDLRLQTTPRALRVIASFGLTMRLALRRRAALACAPRMP